MKKLFVVPFGAELPTSYGFTHLEGDLVDILSTLRAIPDTEIGAYAALTEDQLAVLTKERAVLNSPDMAVIAELGVDYSNAFLLYSEFMDVISVRDLETYLIEQGQLKASDASVQTATVAGVEVNATPSKTSEVYHSI